jgi:long-chain acyl-CoA synthetase
MIYQKGKKEKLFIVKIDENGWVFFLDRSGDIIKHKGYRVVPSKVERVLNEHPSVTAACVIGIPDPEVGEKIKALVVLKKEVTAPHQPKK